MALSAEFRHHLHELMVEVSDQLRDDLNDHRRKLIGEAQRTHNAAGIPGAYSKASLSAFRARVSATIARYLEALDTFGIEVDDSVEKEMLALIAQLTNVEPSLSLPTAVKPSNISAIQRAHKMEASRIGNSLYREAANRLREIKVKSRRTRPATTSAITMPGTDPFTIASVAKTLSELKTLPVSDQAKLLLRRLVRIEPQVRSSGGLNKHNLLLPGDPWGLAAGFAASENEAVRTHLLCGPWTRLVNDGFLVDPRGSGFFLISEEGQAANSAADAAKAEMTSKADGVPTAFISYSWETDGHKRWVLRLAERLHSQGVRVILDQWDLKIGGDRTHFMEDSISASEFVLIICTPTYAQKANKRDGGVGYEAMTITGQIAKNILQDKFIPILRSGRFDDSAVPIWLQTKIGVDLRGDPYDDQQYQLLLRAVHKVQPSAPPVGPKPVFSPSVSSKEGLAQNAVSALLEPDTGKESISAAPSVSSDRLKRSPIAYAWYETTGTNADRIQLYVRPADDNGQLFEFDTSTGENIKGTESEIAQKYLIFDRQLQQTGYKRMQTFNGAAGQSFNLP